MLNTANANPSQIPIHMRRLIEYSLIFTRKIHCAGVAGKFSASGLFPISCKIRRFDISHLAQGLQKCFVARLFLMLWPAYEPADDPLPVYNDGHGIAADADHLVSDALGIR